jgi:hypothetical protein
MCPSTFQLLELETIFNKVSPIDYIEWFEVHLRWLLRQVISTRRSFHTLHDSDGPCTLRNCLAVIQLASASERFIKTIIPYNGAENGIESNPISIHDVEV